MGGGMSGSGMGQGMGRESEGNEYASGPLWQETEEEES
jgi:hypothetical protein